jgi:hypothetical protein
MPGASQVKEKRIFRAISQIQKANLAVAGHPVNVKVAYLGSPPSILKRKSRLQGVSIALPKVRKLSPTFTNVFPIDYRLSTP